MESVDRSENRTVDSVGSCMNDALRALAELCENAVEDTPRRGGSRSGAGRPLKRKSLSPTAGLRSNARREKENERPVGNCPAACADVDHRRGPKISKMWRKGAKADRRRRRQHYETLRRARLEEEEDAASLEWEALETVCSDRLTKLPSRDRLRKTQVARISVQLHTLREYFRYRKIQASTKLVCLQMAADHAKVSVKTIRNWLFLFKATNGEMLADEEEDDDTVGCWLLESEEGRKEAVSFVRQQSIISSGAAAGKPMTVDDFHGWVNAHLLPNTLGIDTRIGRTTAHAWLRVLGFKHKTAKKGVFVDGHDRPDVVEFRNDKFLPKMAEIER